MWYVYVIECKDGLLYTGITNNLKVRIGQHNRGRGCRFTKFRMSVKLLYNEAFLEKNDALKREVEIKGWTRRRKLALVVQS